jgi:hypothetical protein
MELDKIARCDRYVEGAIANIEWTLRQQTDYGFFLQNAFSPGANANTHSIGYVLSGLVGAYLLTGEERYRAAAEQTVDRIEEIYLDREELVSEFGEQWDERSRLVCLVGKCQIAIVMVQLHAIGGKRSYFDTARRLIEDVKARQVLNSPSWPIYGGIPGSYPIYGRYAPLQFPNWAAKFFVDALLMKMEHDSQGVRPGKEVRGVSPFSRFLGDVSLL